MVRSILTGVLGAACLASAASAQSGIYVDFNNVVGAPIPSSSFGAATGIPGAWNSVDPSLSAGGFLMSGPLTDTGGNPTAIELEIDGAGFDPLGFAFDEPNTTGDDAALIDDIIYYVGPATYTFTNVPPGTYDVYTYAMAPDVPAWLTSVEVTGSATGATPVGGDFSAGYAVGTTHALHTVTVGAGGTIEVITMPDDPAVDTDSINGIQIIPSGGPVPLGTNYCTAVANSTGAAASISAVGSAVASDNNVTLNAAGMPPMQFGIFLTSETQASTPVAAGTLCLGGNLIRFQGPGQILQADANGEYSLQIDTQALPAGVPTPIMPGETWNFTTWFRDVDPVIGNTANFSDGVSIVFI